MSKSELEAAPSSEQRNHDEQMKWFLETFCGRAGRTAEDEGILHMMGKAGIRLGFINRLLGSQMLRGNATRDRILPHPTPEKTHSSPPLYIATITGSEALTELQTQIDTSQSKIDPQYIQVSPGFNGAQIVYEISSGGEISTEPFFPNRYDIVTVAHNALATAIGENHSPSVGLLIAALPKQLDPSYVAIDQDAYTYDAGTPSTQLFYDLSSRRFLQQKQPDVPSSPTY